MPNPSVDNEGRYRSDGNPEDSTDNPSLRFAQIITLLNSLQSLRETDPESEVEYNNLLTEASQICSATGGVIDVFMRSIRDGYFDRRNVAQVEPIIKTLSATEEQDNKKKVEAQIQKFPKACFAKLKRGEFSDGELDPSKKSEEHNELHNLYTRMAIIETYRELINEMDREKENSEDRDKFQEQLDSFVGLIADKIGQLKEEFQIEDGFGLLLAQMGFIDLPSLTDEIINTVSKELEGKI